MTDENKMAQILKNKITGENEMTDDVKLQTTKKYRLFKVVIKTTGNGLKRELKTYFK